MSPANVSSWDAVRVSELRLVDSELPQQTATRTRLSLQTSAQVTVELGTGGRFERREIAPGSFCITPERGEIPAARWRGERRIVVAELSPALVASVAESHRLKNFELLSRHGINDSQVAHLMLVLREEMHGGNPAGQAYVDMVARALVLRLLRAHAGLAPPRLRRGGLARSLLHRVLEYIDAHVDQNLGLQTLAALSGLSEDHFARAFRAATGVPPYRYLLQRRLARARQLLESSNLTIVEIAQELGFSDQSHLTKLFRRETGMTPREVRVHLGWTRDRRRKLTNGSGIRQEARAIRY
jgi:AraC family transcriptional regulator